MVGSAHHTKQGYPTSASSVDIPSTEPTTNMQPDDLLCYCFHVSHRKVMNYARIHQPTVPSQLSECGGAGTGCGWCVPFLKKHFEAHRSAAQADIAMTADEYAAERQLYLEKKKAAKRSQADLVDGPGSSQPDD